MEDEDQNELLQSTDDDDSSVESDEQCLQLDKPDLENADIQKCIISNKLQFFITMSTVILSSTSLTILLPIYLESLTGKSNIYVMMQFSTLFATVILISAIPIAKKASSRYTTVIFCKPPICWSNVAKLSIICVVCGFMILHSLDQKRVACHIQDPLKGMILVFSLIYYFLFCKQLMRLQSIFSTTTIIVGLFIAIDYGLCNKFRCRGVEYSEDDAQFWSLQTHVVWTIIYVVGLALFAGFFTLLERYVVPIHSGSTYANRSSFLLTTVSCVVSSRDSHASGNNQVISEVMPFMNQAKKKAPSALHLATWIQIFIWILTTSLFWINLIPFGKVSNGAEFLNITQRGFLCHFSAPYLFKQSNIDCANLSMYAWFFLLAYVGYILSSISLLILCQSAVFVVAVSVSAIPLATVWWSLVHMDKLNPGMLVWDPSLTGELICALLGIPIIAVGLFFLCKWHFRDTEIQQTNMQHATDPFQEA